MQIAKDYSATVKAHVERAAKAYVAAMIPIVAALVLSITDLAHIDFRAMALTLVAATTQWAGVYYTANYKPMLEDLADEAD